MPAVAADCIVQFVDYFRYYSCHEAQTISYFYSLSLTVIGAVYTKSFDLYLLRLLKLH